jgi:hypothetical protein
MNDLRNTPSDLVLNKDGPFIRKSEFDRSQVTHDEQTGSYRSKDENGRSRIVQPETSRGDVISFYAYSAKLLLFACS